MGNIKCFMRLLLRLDEIMHKKAYRGQIGGCQRWVMGVGEMSKKGGQKVQTSSYKILSLGDVMSSM